MPAIMEQINQMSAVEKMQTMDYIWQSLSTDTSVQFPAWHEDELRKTEERVAKGIEGSIDWEAAKSVLAGMR